MSNDCGFLANIKEEGTKNTYQPLCQNSTALIAYQDNVLKHFQTERDGTKHQGQTHFPPSPCLSLMHKKRDQAPNAAPKQLPSLWPGERRQQEELTGSSGMPATESPPPPSCRAQGALPGGAFSAANSQELRQKEQHRHFPSASPKLLESKLQTPAERW